MIDIDKQLEKLDIKTIKPDDSLVMKTKNRMRTAAKKQNPSKKKKIWKAFAVVVPAAAIVLLVVMFMVMGGRTAVTAESAFYTIDINPSIVLEVNDANKIISVTCRNDEALELMANIKCLGLDIKAAIPKVVAEAKRLGYISDDQENYVLIASFGADKGSLSEEELNTIIQNATGGETNVLYLMGSLKDKEAAEEKGKSAGIYLLEKHAKEQGIVKEDFEPDNQKGSLKEDIEAINPPVSNIKAKLENGVLTLEWEQINHKEFSGYKVVASKNNEHPKYPDDGYLKYITDKNITKLEITDGFSDLSGGETYWFSITALYKGGFKSFGDSVKAEVPNAGEATSTPVSEDKVSSKISGIAVEDAIKLKWDKVTHSDFKGYKVVASKTNPNPKYPDDGYLKYITDANTTTMAFDLSNFDSGAKYWFSITVLYSDGTKVAGNSIALDVPEHQNGSTGVASEITGRTEGDSVKLSWEKIDSSKFKGYKVVASKTNHNPKYPDDGYLKYITNANTTTMAFDLSDFESGAKYWFSITVLYSDGTKVAGNSIALDVPEYEHGSTGTSSEISGYTEGNYVKLSWGKIDSSKFKGYKVVASKTNHNPKYPDDGYIKYITNADTTSKAFDLSNFESGAKYWFSITVLYDDGTKVPGNSIALDVPEYDQGSAGAASKIAGYTEGDFVKLSWEKIASSQFKGYKVVASKTNPNPKYPDDGYLKYITDSNTTGINVNEGFSGLEGGIGYYFSITVLYKDGIKVPGNSVYIVVPDSVSGSSGGASEISGTVVEDTIHLQWDKATDPSFQGYKVVASADNPNPKYPEDGYIKYTTNINGNSLIVYDGYNGLTGGESYYFSITVLYSDGTKVPGNSVHLTVPVSESGTGEHAASTITGSAEGGMVNLSWTSVNNSKFSGYKVVASSTNPNPAYPADGYLQYITDSGQTTFSSAVTNFEPNKPYWFSITVLYSDGTKVAGNAIKLDIPEGVGLPSATITGSVSSGKVVLDWNKIDHVLFQGYKVVNSKTNPNPKYPNDGYLQYITDSSTIHYESAVGNFESGATYWFSITVLYTNGTKIAGNAVQIQIP